MLYGNLLGREERTNGTIDKADLLLKEKEH